jgi:heptosyltransferase-2
MPSLIVRLPNHLGDACMALPALERLAAQGIGLDLVGRPWARELLGGRGWNVQALPAGRLARLAALRAWRVQAPPERAALLLTNSFSSALEFRAAGWRPMGYARDGRSPLLQPAIAVPREWSGAMHTIDYYLHLADAALARLVPGRAAAKAGPAVPRIAADEAAQARAQAALAQAGVAARGYAVVCPIARGQHQGRDKRWPGFGRLAAELVRRGVTVVVAPGPGEAAEAAAAVPQARLLAPLDLGAFTALLAGSRLVVANDSGPAHLAAAAGACVIVVIGVTDPAKTCPRGERVHAIGKAQAWPVYDSVAALALALLARSS